MITTTHIVGRDAVCTGLHFNHSVKGYLSELTINLKDDPDDNTKDEKALHRISR